MGNRSKNIGKAFEREVADILSNFFGLNFQRVPNSGAFIGGQNYVRIQNLSEQQVLLARGDLIPPSELQRLIIECKKRKSIPYHQIIQEAGCKELNNWIDQVEIDFNICPEVEIFLLVFKSNNCGKFVLFPKGSLNSLPSFVEYIYKDKLYTICEFNNMFLTLNKELLLEKCNPLN